MGGDDQKNVLSPFCSGPVQSDFALEGEHPLQNVHFLMVEGT